MAKTTVTTTNNRSKKMNYLDEDMSETEEYFQSAIATGKGKESSSISKPQNTDRIDNDVTIGLLPVGRDEYEEDFEDILLESIDETLSSLGEPVKNSIYLHLQNDFKIEKSDIPKKISVFSDIIHKIFGFGAGRLEIRFMKTLCSKLNINAQWSEHESPISNWIVSDFTFPEYIYNMRRSYYLKLQKEALISLKVE